MLSAKLVVLSLLPQNEFSEQAVQDFKASGAGIN
jgi:hypothetical protein